MGTNDTSDKRLKTQMFIFVLFIYIYLSQNGYGTKGLTLPQVAPQVASQPACVHLKSLRLSDASEILPAYFRVKLTKMRTRKMTL